MATRQAREAADAILSVMNLLEIDRFHIAGRQLDDCHGLVEKDRERIASLALVEPGVAPAALVNSLNCQVTLLTSSTVPHRTEDAKNASQPSYVQLPSRGIVRPWTDVVKDNADQVTHYFNQLVPVEGVSSKSLSEQSGYLDDISFKISGKGPALVLLPLSLAPTGWDSVKQALEEQYSVIQLGGPLLGFLPFLATRGHSESFCDMVDSLVNRMKIPTNDTCRVLEVGSGSGVLLRRVAQQFQRISLTGLELSPYLVEEACALAARAGLSERVDFKVGNAEDLSSFADDTFDAVYSITVAEELDAQKMISEMVRVCKPGGSIGTIVRAVDMKFQINVPLTGELREELNEFEAGFVVAEDIEPHCTTANLYSRFFRAGLDETKYGPFLTIFRDSSDPVVGLALGSYIKSLNAKKMDAWTEAIQKAESEGTFFMAWPHHLASGFKPLKH